MTLFGIFNKRKKGDKNIAPFQLSPETSNSTKEKVMDDAYDVEETATGNKPLTVSFATGWPIDVIYGYLHKNYEQKGYEDAMLNSNLAFRDMNISIIRNKILMVFREINLNYDAMKNDLETRIETCSAAGLLTTVADLTKQMSIINTHKNELAQLEQDFRNNVNEASVPLMSYECGFLRGVSNIAMAGPTRNQNLMTPVVPSFNAPSVAV